MWRDLWPHTSHRPRNLLPCTVGSDQPLQPLATPSHSQPLRSLACGRRQSAAELPDNTECHPAFEHRRSTGRPHRSRKGALRPLILERCLESRPKWQKSFQKIQGSPHQSIFWHVATQGFGTLLSEVGNPCVILHKWLMGACSRVVAPATDRTNARTIRKALARNSMFLTPLVHWRLKPSRPRTHCLVLGPPSETL